MRRFAEFGILPASEPAPQRPPGRDDLRGPTLRPRHYAPDTPAVLVHRATQSEERTHRATEATLLDGVKLSDFRLTTLVMVGDVLRDVPRLESRLYAAEYPHRFRRAEDVPQ